MHTSKGQVTVPGDIRRALGVREGDHLLFESVGPAVLVRGLRTNTAFSKYRGLGNPGLGCGRRQIAAWLCLLRQ